MLASRAVGPRRLPGRPASNSLLGLDRGAWLLFAAQGLSGLGTAPFLVFGAIYQRQLGASAVEIGLVAALGVAVATLSMIPGTRWAEGFHLRPTILAGWLIAIPAPLLFAVAPHWQLTAVGTIFLSASVLNTPAINVYLTLGVPRDRIALHMMTVLSSFSLALIVATPLTGWLAQWMGVRWLFMVAFLFFCLAGLCVAFLPKKQLPEDAMARIRYRDLFQHRSFITLLALFSAITMIIFMPWPFITLFAQEVGRADNLQVGVLMASLYLGSVLMGLTLGRLRRRAGSLSVVLCFEAAYILSAAVLLGSRTLTVLFIAFFLRGAFWSFRQVMTAVIGETLPTRALAKGYGLFALVTGVAAALSYPMGGWLYARDPMAPFWVSAILMVLAIGASLVVRAAFGGGSVGRVPAVTPRVADEALPEAA